MTNKFKPTDEQNRVATHSRAFALVEACAGAGKTATIAERFGRLAFGSAGDDRGVLVCAYTREATNELRDRIDRRFGPNSLRWPHACWTIDQLARHLFELLASHGLLGPELKALDGISAVLDSWQGHEKSVWVAKPPEGRFRRKLADDRRYQRASLGTFRKKGPTVSLLAHPTRGNCFDIKDKRAELLSGTWTHQDIRDFVISSMMNPKCRDLVVDYVRSRWLEIIVDECFDANEEDVKLWEQLRAGASSVSLLGDPWQAIFDFRESSDTSALTTWAAGVGVDDDPPLTLTVSLRHSPEMAELCDRARTKKTLALPQWTTIDAPLDIVLGRNWEHLRIPGVRPDRLGALHSCTHAIVELGYQQLLRGPDVGGESHLALLLGMSLDFTGRAAFPDVRRCLLAAPSMDSLVGTVEEAFDEVGVTRKSFRRSFAASCKAKANDKGWLEDVEHRLGFAKLVGSDGARRVRGVSIHASKGREWGRVGLVTTDDLAKRLLAGLDRDNEEDRVVFVGLSRAKSAVYLYG
jgi:DNA helicase II / ATP-dependent DNA helicase PcrA